MDITKIKSKMLTQIFAMAFGAVLCLITIVLAFTAHRLSVNGMRVLLPIPWIAAFVGTYYVIKRSQQGYASSYASKPVREQALLDSDRLEVLRKLQSKYKVRLVWLLIVCPLLILLSSTWPTRIAGLVGLGVFGAYLIYLNRTIKRGIAQLQAKSLQNENEGVA